MIRVALADTIDPQSFVWLAGKPEDILHAMAEGSKDGKVPPT